MKKHKYQPIALIVLLVLVGAGSWFTLHAINEPKTKHEPILVFKDDITFKIGQLSFEEEDMPNDPERPTITVESILKPDVSDYDVASFNKVPCGDQPQDMMFRFIDTAEEGSYEGTIYAAKDNVCKTYTFNYRVEA